MHGAPESNAPQPLGTDDLFSEQTILDRRLGLAEALSIVFGRIIGSGIFRTPGLIMAAVGGYVGLFYGGWIIGGIATLLGAFCYAEMVAMMPRSGGPYAYLKAAYHPVWTFLRGWAMFFVSETAVIVTVALVFAEYGNVLFKAATGAAYSHAAKISITFAIIWILTAVNLFGVRFSGMFQNIFSALKLLALLSIATLGFLGPGDVGNFTHNVWPQEFGWHSVVMIGAALRYSFFAYSGWEGATYVAEEVRNPRRNLPLSILLGIVAVMALYLVVNSAYLFQLSPAEFVKAERQISSVAMERAIGEWGGLFIAGCVMLSVFGNVAAQILAKGRTWFSMARDGLFPAFLARIHPRFHTPNNALLAQAAWASVILFVAAFAENSYRDIIDFFSFTSALFNVSTYLAVWRLRQKYPDANRPYKTWGYPVTMILIVLIQLAFMVVTLYDAPLPSLLGLAMTLTGLLYYYRENLGRRLGLSRPPA